MSKKPSPTDKDRKTEAPSGPEALSISRKAPINAKLGKDELIRFYRDMVRIRRFEERCLRAYQQGKIGGFLHLYIGQESVAIGCVSVMNKNDHIITS